MTSRRRLLLSVSAVLVALLALAFTYARLFRGIDLLDESFYVAVPYRWVLGGRPFVDEMNLLQIAALFTYPFVKAYVWLTGGSAALMLYTRHLYLLFAIGVAAAVFALLRTIMRWQLAVAAAAVYVSFFAFDLPQLDYNTLASGFLTLGAVLALWTILHGRSRWYLAATGVLQMLGVVVYPTLALVLPVWALCLLAVTGAGRWRALAAWVAGAAVTGAAFAAVLVSFGVGNVARCVRFQLADARRVGQGGGFTKVHLVVSGPIRLITSRNYILVIALLVLLVYQRRPGVRRLLVVLLPLALLAGGERSVLKSAGFAIMFGLLAPYLYLYVGRERRALATKLLVWGFVPAAAAALVTGYTSAVGYPNCAVGFIPGMFASAALFVFAMEPRARQPAGESRSQSPGPRVRPLIARWLATLDRLTPDLTLFALAAIVAVTIVFQFQYLPRFVPYSQTTKRMDFGPWEGIYTTPVRYAYLRQVTDDLHTYARPSDRILFFSGFPAGYLMWPYRMAANTVWITNADGVTGPLPKTTYDYFERKQVVPDVVFRVWRTAPDAPAGFLDQLSGGLPYPLIAVRPNYLVFRRPAGFTAASVPAQLR
jgi:hypothetical protein